MSQWRAADGWSHRRLAWPAAAGMVRRGSLLFQAGRGDFLEKYIEPMDHFSRQGWDVASFDWRGQGGSHGERYANGAADPDQLVADMANFIAEWQAETPPPHVALGHSLGGHVLLRALGEDGVRLDAAVLVAPMLGLNSAPVPIGLAAMAARGLCALGLGRNPAWKAPNERLSPSGASQRAILTHCSDHYADELWWRQTNPALRLAPPSWEWLVAAHRANRAIERAGSLEKIDIPILILASAADRLVSLGPIRRAAARLPRARLHIYDSRAAHEILRESDPVRLDALARIDDFLAAVEKRG